MVIKAADGKVSGTIDAHAVSSNEDNTLFNMKRA
jgi:hypothetical protein